MIRKKAQGEIITTVLIILLVLGAIVIVWQVVNSSVGKSGRQSQSAASCLGIQMSIEGAITANLSSNQTTLSIKRGKDNVGVDGLRIYLTNRTGGVQYNETIPSALVPSAYNTNTLTVQFANMANGSNVIAVAPKIGAIQCDPVVSKSFATYTY